MTRDTCCGITVELTKATRTIGTVRGNWIVFVASSGEGGARQTTFDEYESEEDARAACDVLRECDDAEFGEEHEGREHATRHHSNVDFATMRIVY